TARARKTCWQVREPVRRGCTGSFLFPAANSMKAGAIVAVLVLLSAMNSGAGAAPDRVRVNAWTTPHVLTISDGGDPNTLNPHLTQSAVVANLREMTMAWLVRWNKRNQPYPELAMEVPTRANGGV